MRFLILLVAGALATKECWIDATAGNKVAANQCDTSATDATKIACSATNCAFGTGNVARQWGTAWDADVETLRVKCATGAVAASDNCAYCKELLECSGDMQTAGDAAEKVAGFVAPDTCKKAKDASAALALATPACKANVAWSAGNAPTCASDSGAANTLTVPATLPKYGPADTKCTKAIFDKCNDRFGCADFTWVGTYKAPTDTTTTEPAGTCADKDGKAQATLKTKKTCEAVTGNVWTVTKADKDKKSPAAMISAGIALIALLF